MAKNNPTETNLTSQVRSLSNVIFGRSAVKDSILDRAILYFETQRDNQDLRDQITNELAPLVNTVNKVASKDAAKFQKKIMRLEVEQDILMEKLNEDRNVRLQQILTICRDIITICDSGDFDECNKKSAQVLATIQLLNPTDGKQVASAHEQSKPLYKSILCLRLLDRLCIKNIISESYISERLGNITPDQYKDFSTINPEGYQRFIDEVKIPLLMAALLQDIGNYHPDAQIILKGVDGKEDPYRMLQIEDRKKLLQIDYRETVKFLVDGLGPIQYVGNSKEGRDKFNIAEREKLLFIKRLLKSSINPKQGMGNLLKVPQIYVSIILSTKENYNYKLLPKVYQVLNQNVERGSCSKNVVDALYAITGVFPQGYGVTYIPTDSDGKEQDRYEYAIVNELYPEIPEEPNCRSATRHLTFISHGQNIIIKEKVNLYFPETAKKLARISKERLHEILELLSSNYLERQKLDLLPRCWHAKEYFSLKKNQKLWNK